MNKPKIKIVAGGGLHNTQVFNADGVELTDVRKVSFTHEAGSIPQATLEVLLVNGEMQAELVALEKEIVPPLRLEESIQLKVSPPRKHWGRMRSRYSLIKYIPLPTWGTRTELLARGWTAPIGPLTIERTVK